MGFTRTSVVYATPSLTLGTANAAGSLASAIRSDSTLLVYDATVAEDVTSGASTAGDSSTAAHRNHVHGIGAAGVSAADQTEMEAASSTTVYASPGTVQFHPGICKTWCTINSNGSLRAMNYNIASITDTATGDRTIVFDDDFSGTSYTAVAQTDNTSTSVTVYKAVFSGQAVGSVRLRIFNPSSALVDIESCQLFLGEQ